MAGHRLAAVRTVAIHAWAAADNDHLPEIPARLAADTDARVRQRVAQFAATIAGRLGEAADPILAALDRDRSWAVRYHVRRASR